MDGKTWVLWADAVVEWNLLYGSLNIQRNIYHKAEEEQRMVGVRKASAEPIPARNCCTEVGTLTKSVSQPIESSLVSCNFLGPRSFNYNNHHHSRLIVIWVRARVAGNIILQLQRRSWNHINYGTGLWWEIRVRISTQHTQEWAIGPQPQNGHGFWFWCWRWHPRRDFR